MKPRLTAILIAALICISIAAAVYAAGEWPMYRHDPVRSGRAEDGAMAGTRPVPIWVFPYPEPEVDPVDNDVLDPTGVVVTDRPNFTTTGTWYGIDSTKAPNAYQGDAVYTVAGSDATAQWEFRLASQKAQLVGYYVYVWFPSQAFADQYPVPGGASRLQTTNARYVVQIVNDNGSISSASSYRVDQSSGGNWTVLAPSPFMVRDDQFVRVVLTTQGADEYSVVVADGVSLVQDLGHVLSSPALARGNTGIRDDDLVISCVTENRPIQTVTVRQPATDEHGNNVRDENGNIVFTNKTVQDGKYPVKVGSVYGIAAEDDPNTGGLDERGIPKWWFPYDKDNWIAGGFSSSPVIGTYNGQEVAYCPAKDGQVYVLRTGPVTNELTDRLVWQGPGYIKDPVVPASWAYGTHGGYQGDGYRQTTAVKKGASGESKATWEFDIRKKGEYSVYAWIPPSTQAEIHVPDAAYKVTVGTREAEAATADQAKGGRWALLGKYTTGADNTSVTIELSNVSEIMNVDDPSTVTRYVVADQIKIVPSHLDIFDWCSPVISADGSRIYIGSTSGRLYCLEIGNPDPVWVYPDPYDDDAGKRNPMGSIEASPTLNGDTIYIGSADGHVYAVGTDGKEKWVYPSKNPDDGPLQTLGQISGTIAVDVARKILYVPIGSDVWVPPGAAGPDTAGRIIAIKDNTSSAAQVGIYPDPDAGEDARGSFLWSSPLLYDNETLMVGSSDGYLVGLTPSNLRPKWVDADGDPAFPDLINEIYSSPAGVNVTSEGIPMAYVGTQGGFLHGIDLRTGRKHWYYRLPGAIASSPAIAEERLYVGDMSGLTWAFSSRPGSGPGGLEEWNDDIGGPTPDPGEGVGKESFVEVDIFTQAEYNKIKDGVKLSDGDLHKLARAQKDYNPGQQPGHSHYYPYPYEWGETIYVIAWNCFDPNNADDEDEETKWLTPDKRGTKFVPETDSTLRLTVKSRAPGDQADQSTAFTMSEKGAVWDDKNKRPVYYAKYAYVLGTSSSSSTQAPGSYMTITVQELPSTKTDSPNKGATTGDCVVPEHKDSDPILPKKPNPDPNLPDIYDHSKFKPQRIAINNPLGLAYTDPSNSANEWLIAVEEITGGYRTHRYKNSGHNLVSHNGNRRHSMPWVRTGLVAHGTNSDESRVMLCDRSLIALTGNRLSKFRVERSDLGWTGGPDHIWRAGGQSTWLPWEDSPPVTGPNASKDYPDIRGRQVNFAMTESRIDPTLEEANLRPGALTPGIIPASDDKWTVGRSPVSEVISVPRYQPANMAFATSPTDLQLRSCGYRGIVFTFIDSNNDGRLSLPGQLGSSRLYQQSVTGGRSEAYREFYTQVHVPPDYRVEVGEKTFDIGAVPHGFGLTAQGGPLPGLFWPRLGQNAVLELPRSAPGAPIQTTPGGVEQGGFDPWFKSFTAYNHGNVNLLNVQVARAVNTANGDRYSLDLFSDTAEGGMYRSGPNQLSAYGARLPAYAVVSALDQGFLDNEPLNFPPIRGLNSRTFHKPRVGDQPTVLRLPDMPKRLYDSDYSPPSADPNQPDAIPQLPIISVAVPVGTPVGTYSQKLTLFEDIDRDGRYDPRESVGNPLMELKVTVTENRLTDGYMPGALPQIDIPVPNISIGDVAPAVFRDAGNNMHMFWSSSRGSATPTAADPWFLHKSTLVQDSDQYWNLAQPNLNQWWSPAVSIPGGELGKVASFFSSGPGTVMPNSVKFTSPSIAQDPYDPAATWLFFGAQATKSVSPDAKASQYKAFYWPLDANGDPVGDAILTTRDWTMPKYGIKGTAARFGSNLTLWTFWYGGNNNEWRIFYNMSPIPGKKVGADDSWSNDGRLDIPRGLVSAAEPSIVPRADKRALDVVYSAYSQYHKNADIYLSRYALDDYDPSTGVRDLDMISAGRIEGEILVRDPESAIYSSRNVDWETSSMAVEVGGAGYATPLRIDRGTPTRDPQTRALIYTYAGTSAEEQQLRNLFRSVVIDPAAGTVKFLRDPGPRAVVMATYRPRAYRLTTDGAADTSPCALFDNGPNMRYYVTPGNFWLPGSYAGAFPVDRMWVLWRRPSTVMKGTSIFYKSMRYTIVLNDQITMNAGADIEFSASGSGPAQPAGPVEIDWAKKRLYFTAADEGKKFNITYPNAAGTESVEVGTVALMDELDAYGHAFGNLTSEVANEGQVCAIRDPDPWSNKLWVFWTSARAGNTDVYYETICPRFYAREFK